MKKAIMMFFLALCITASSGGINMLNMNFSAPALGSGSVCSVDYGDYSSILTNPSLLSVSGWNFAKISFYKYLMDMNYGAVSAGLYIPKFGNIAFTYGLGNYGYQESRDAEGNTGDDFYSGEHLFAVTMSDMIVKSVYAGVNIKYLYSTIGEYSSDSIYLDFGMAFRLKKFFAGFYVKNWGTRVEYIDLGDFTAIDAGIGASYSFSITDKLNLKAMMDLNQSGGESVINAGIELSLGKAFGLRFGSSDLGNDFSRKIGAGVSVLLKNIMIDISYSVQGDIPATYAAGMSYVW